MNLFIKKNWKKCNYSSNGGACTDGSRGGRSGTCVDTVGGT